MDRGRVSRVFALKTLVVVTALLLWVYPRLSFACSPVHSYLRPSNYELVKETEVIVLATAVKYETSHDGDRKRHSRFHFRIDEVIKGRIAEDAIADVGYDKFRGRSPEGEFGKARPGAYAGSCIARDYKLDQRYLLFLNKFQGDWRVSGPPFTRVNEEVDGPKSPWVAAVREYVRIAAFGKYETENQALKDLRAQAAQGTEPTRYPLGLVADIDSHFASPSEHKSFDDLMHIYSASQSEQTKDKVLWAFYRGSHPEALPFMRQLLAVGKIGSGGQVAAYLGRVKDTQSVEGLARIYLNPETEKRVVWQVAWPWIVYALMSAADASHKKIMLQVLNGSDEEEASRLVAWFVKYPSPEALQVVKGLASKSRFTYSLRMFPGLAGLGDAEVVEWATSILKDPNKQKAAEDRWVAEEKSRYPDMDDHMLRHTKETAKVAVHQAAIAVVAWSPLEAADLLAIQVMKGRSEDLTTLAWAYSKSFNPKRWQRMQEIIGLTATNPTLGGSLTRDLKELVYGIEGVPVLTTADERERAKTLLQQLE